MFLTKTENTIDFDQLSQYSLEYLKDYKKALLFRKNQYQIVSKELIDTLNDVTSLNDEVIDT